jgi:hypothetical protein
MEVNDEPEAVSFPNDPANRSNEDDDDNDDEHGPMSPNLKPSGRRRSRMSCGPNKPATAPPELLEHPDRPPLSEVPALTHRLHTMALLHARTTAQLLQAQQDKHDAEQRAAQEDANFELVELRHELSLKTAECDALQRALDTELAAWTSRCAASEARATALYAERASLAGELHRLRADADAAREEARREMAAVTRRGDEQLDQLSRLFLLSSRRCSASPRSPVKPTGMDALFSSPTLDRTVQQ